MLVHTVLLALKRLSLYNGGFKATLGRMARSFLIHQNLRMGYVVNGGANITLPTTNFFPPPCLFLPETILGERSEIGRFEPPVFHQGKWPDMTYFKGLGG